MNVTKLSVTPDQARAKLREVRTSLHRKADAEYVALEQAYQAAADGKALIRLSEAITGAPRDAKGRPSLAIARADRRQVMVQVNGWQNSGFCTFNALSENGVQSGIRSETLVMPIEWDRTVGPARGYALVPIVPPDVLNRITPKALSGYHILFEVEAWADERIGAKPDIDPYLLRHVGGDLWAVIAEWDLTSIERAVMAGRARA